MPVRLATDARNVGKPMPISIWRAIYLAFVKSGWMAKGIVPLIYELPSGSTCEVGVPKKADTMLQAILGDVLTFVGLQQTSRYETAGVLEILA